MASPKIAVVICAYNEEAYLGRALDALTKQNYPKDLYEVIVVDNASTDKTAEVIRQHGATLVFQPQKGIPFAMQAGFDYAVKHGYEIIAGTDADSEVSLGWLSVIAARFTENPEVVGVTGPVVFYDVPGVINWITKGTYWSFVILAGYLGGFVQFIGSNMAVRSTIYSQVGGVDTRYLISADVDLSRRFLPFGKIEFVPKMLVRVSPRRFKKQPLRALRQYLGGLISVLKHKPSGIELDDIR